MLKSKLVKRLLLVPAFLLLSVVTWGQSWGPAVRVNVAVAPVRWVRVNQRWQDDRWERERAWREHEWRERGWRVQQWRRYHRREEWREHEGRERYRRY